MNSAANPSFNNNKSQVSHQAPASEDAIHQSDVEPDVEPNISRPNNSSSSDGPVKPTQESPDDYMAKELHQATEAVTDTTLLNSPESHDQEHSETDAPDRDSTIVRQHPIAPPSEPKQYRAIGLVRGRYQPSTEQFTRGSLQTPDGTEIDAVLLGRVMSLLKNHLDLQAEHLWVVYPRTRQQDDDLHIQIMGVWEPETLRKTQAPTEESTVEAEHPKDLSFPTISPTAADDESGEIMEVQEDVDNSHLPNPEIPEDDLSNVDDGYFSIRGEVIYQSQDQEYVILKVRQSPRKDEEEAKFFKLKLKGNLGDRPLNHFWDLHIQRQETSLVIQYGNDIGALFFNRRQPLPRGQGRFSGGNNRRGSYSRNPRPQSFNPPTDSTPPIRKEATPKPIKRKKEQD
jgi:hypothetical protein